LFFIAVDMSDGVLGGIAPLLMLSKSLNINSLCLGIAALRRLANTEQNWVMLINAGLIIHFAVQSLL
jgi:hypothetical protein